MIKKLSRYGNTLSLDLDESILKILSIDETTALSISTDGTTIFINPLKVVTPVSNDSKIQKAFEETLETYAEDFRKLAKN